MEAGAEINFSKMIPQAVRAAKWKLFSLACVELSTLNCNDLVILIVKDNF